MSDPLSQYLAQRQGTPTDAEHLRRQALGLATGLGEGMSPYVPPNGMDYLAHLGVPLPGRHTAIKFAELPENVRVDLAQAQPMMSRLPKDYDFKRLVDMANAYKEKLPPQLYRLMSSVGILGQARQAASNVRAVEQAGLLFLNEAGRQATFGIVPKISEDLLKDADLGPRGQAISTIFGDLVGIGVAGTLVVGALGAVTKAPKIAAVVAQIPQRIREITFGFTVGATLDALRPDGLPPEPAGLDFPGRMGKPISEFLGGGQVADRVGLAIGGGVTGAVIGEVLGPVLRGISLMRQNKVISQVASNPEIVAAMRRALGDAGVPIASTDRGADIVRKTMENLDRVSQSQRLAGVVSARLAREDYIMSQLMSDPQFVASEDARYMAALFRTNPGGITIAKDITNAKAAQEFAGKMGLQVHTIQVGNDVLMFRPKVQFPEVRIPVKLQQELNNFTEYVKDINRGKPSTTITITPLGDTIRGDYNFPDIAARFKLKPPVVGGARQADVAVLEHLNLVDVKVGEGGQVTIRLPSTVTQDQVRAIGQFVDLGIPNLTLVGGGKTITMVNPIGIQVEDAIAGVVKGASRPKLSADMVRRINQYRVEGVFEGQAARDPSGYPLQVIRRLKGKHRTMIQVRDPMTGYRSLIAEDRITVLPTNLEGEFQPSNLFMRYLDPKEQQMFASLRKSIQDGFAEPVKNFHDLEEFASANGRFATSMGRGRVAIFDPVSQEKMVYDSPKAAVEALKETVGPMPDLTPPDLERMLGFKPNFGGIGGGGPPARFGEPIPLGDGNFEKWANSKTLGQLVPGALELAIVPTRDLLLRLEERYGLPFGRVFLTIQEQIVKRQNFMSAWIDGVGPGLPEGVMPLRKIMRMAGRGAKQELINAWMESEGDATRLAEIAKQMTPGELNAAKELRKVYDHLFDTFGIEQNYHSAYAPHFRQFGEQYGNRIDDIWRSTKGGTPLPKGVEFLADYARDGHLNIYEERAFVQALKYVEIGSHSRYLKTSLNDARLLLKAIPDNAVKAPLANYLEAIRGSEFAPQKAAIDATVARAFRGLGISEQAAREISEKFTLGSIGLIYNSTMAFRLGPVIRNLTQLTQTTWPIFGGLGDELAEGIGRAMTTAGRDAAIVDGAIALKQGARFAAEEIEQAMPKMLNQMSNLGLRLYDGADNFNRAATYWTARIRAERAIDKYGKAIQSGRNLVQAQRDLIVDAAAHIYHKPVVDEFLRKLANNGPESAARWLGKQASDVTQFLYGRGNQPRWMRSVPGRFIGQFGTWPLWYIRSTYGVAGNMIKNGYRWEAVKFLARVAIANMAIYEAGKAAGLDLRRWMAGNSIFYTGGPAVELVRGMADLVRGSGEEFLSTYESPATRARIASGAETLRRVGRVFVPAGGVVNDLVRALSADSPTTKVAAMLGVYPSTEFTVQQRINLLIDTGVTSGDAQLAAEGDNSPTAVQLMNRGMETSNREAGRGTLGMLLGQQQSQTPPPAPQGATREKTRITNARPSGRPPLAPTALPDSIRSGESKPVPQ